MPVSLQDFQQNALISALPAADSRRLLQHLEPVDLQLGRTLHEPGSRQEYVYFPTTALIALLCTADTGQSSGLALVGPEGIAGISLSMGGEATPSRAVVQSAGRGYRLRAHVLRAEFGRGGTLQHLLLRFTQALISQMAQTALCAQRHSLPQQLCRWLLLCLDRLPSNELAVTQVMAADMLGVRVAGMSDAAACLQTQGLIEYSGGRITVLDRARLEGRVCPCYAALRRESDRLVAHRFDRSEAVLA